MNEMAATTVRRLIAEGLPLDILRDFDDLAELNRLGGAVTGTDSRSPEYRKLLNPKLHMGGQIFGRLSIGVRDFLETCLRDWFKDDQKSENYAWVWCYAHSDKPALVWGFQNDPRAFCEEVQRWYRGLTCTPDELFGRLAEWINQGRAASGGGEHKPTELSAMLEEMAKEYGRPISYWMWEVSEDEVALMYSKMRERKAAEDGQRVGEDPDAPVVKRIHAYRTAERNLIEKLKARLAA